MDELGWDSCDIILVTGDAYVDHPSFGMAIIGRLLESQGFRVGIIAQPEWQNKEPFMTLGQPNLFFGITAGNMDSMINRYTADRKIRNDDAYTPGGQGGARPDRATLVYAQRIREAYTATPIVLGGIEASLRRSAHYDYWQDKVRRSFLVDAKADILLYGNAERAIVALAHRLARGEEISTITDLRGSVVLQNTIPEEWSVMDATTLGSATIQTATKPEYQPLEIQTFKSTGTKKHFVPPSNQTAIRLPSYEQVRADKNLYAHANRIIHLETNPGNARALVQQHQNREVWINPPAWPLSTEEMDFVYDLPYQRVPHPRYGQERIPAYEMIRFSVNIMRGCFGGCTFCSITEHEGRIIQNRSEESILREIESIRDKVPGFTGVISDLGGPTANMYRLACRSKEIEAACRKPSCVFPGICSNLNTDHSSLITLYRKARELPGIKKILIGSGVRYDLATQSPEYVKELVTHHVGGYLKIAPEHTESGPLSKMMKPEIDTYDDFKKQFDRFSKEAGKEQYLIPYFIAAHPGTTEEDMLQLALWLKRNGFRADQVQAFYPSPMATATAMYHTNKNPLKKIKDSSETVEVAKGEKRRRLHKAFLRYHDPANWPLLRSTLKKMGREDLIGPGKKQLVPKIQPAASAPYQSARRKNSAIAHAKRQGKFHTRFNPKQ